MQIRDSIIMGSDYYESQAGLDINARTGRPAIGIGANSYIQGAIIDKNARIGHNVVIRAEGKTGNHDSDLYHVRDGIVIIPKNTVVPHGTVI